MNEAIIIAVVGVIGGSIGTYTLSVVFERRKHHAEAIAVETDNESKDIANDVSRLQFFDAAFEKVNKMYTHLMEMAELEKKRYEEIIKQQDEIIATQKTEIIRLNKIIKQKDEIIKKQNTEIKILKKPTT